MTRQDDKSFLFTREWVRTLALSLSLSVALYLYVCVLWLSLRVYAYDVDTNHCITRIYYGVRSKNKIESKLNF